jgi:hypothetical protein
MKNTILILFLIFSYNLSAQDFSISELIGFLGLNSDEVDTRIVKKGFVPNTTKYSKDTNCVFFYEYKNSTIASNDICLYKCKYDGYKINISYRTRKDATYSVFKDQIKNYGFVYKETVNIENGKIIIYNLSKNNKTYELSLATSIYEDFNLYELTINAE